MKDYSDHRYIAACVFTRKYPELSMRIVDYLQERFHMPAMRCCTPNFHPESIAQSVNEKYRPRWEAMPVFEELTEKNTIVYICHNCQAVFEESFPKPGRKSLWEVILEDEDFPYPDYHGMEMTVQDCWRTRDQRGEQLAVRELLKKLNIRAVELEENFDKTQFCGYSLYQPVLPRNAEMAPRRFVEGAQGKFIPHTREENQILMGEYCAKLPTRQVVTYCHYCLDGLKLGGAEAFHLSQLLFPEREERRKPCIPRAARLFHTPVRSKGGVYSSRALVRSWVKPARPRFSMYSRAARISPARRRRSSSGTPDRSPQGVYWLIRENSTLPASNSPATQSITALACSTCPGRIRCRTITPRVSSPSPSNRQGPVWRTISRMAAVACRG